MKNPLFLKGFIQLKGLKKGIYDYLKMFVFLLRIKVNKRI